MASCNANASSIAAIGSIGPCSNHLQRMPRQQRHWHMPTQHALTCANMHWLALGCRQAAFGAYLARQTLTANANSAPRQSGTIIGVLQNLLQQLKQAAVSLALALPLPGFG